MQVGIILAAQQNYITVLQSRGTSLVVSVQDVWIKLYSVMLFMNLRYHEKQHYSVLSDASISAEKGQQHHNKKHSKNKENKDTWVLVMQSLQMTSKETTWY